MSNMNEGHVKTIASLPTETLQAVENWLYNCKKQNHDVRDRIVERYTLKRGRGIRATTIYKMLTETIRLETIDLLIEAIEHYIDEQQKFKEDLR